MADVAEVIPKSAVFAEAKKKDFEPSDDQLCRWRDDGLIGELRPIPGTAQHGFTWQQRERFFTLLELCKALGSQRPRRDELAFRLCWNGAHDVPPEAVCEYIDGAILSFLSSIRRELERKGLLLWALPTDGFGWDRLGKPLGKFIVTKALPTLAESTLARETFSIMSGLALRALFAKSVFAAVSGRLRQVLYVLHGNREPDPSARAFLWDTMRECMGLFSLSEDKNTLLLSIRDINASGASQIIPLVHDARLLVNAMSSVFPCFQDARTPSARNIAPLSTLEHVNRIFPALACAALAYTRCIPHSLEMRRKLREGDYADVVRDFHDMKAAGNLIVQRTSMGAAVIE